MTRHDRRYDQWNRIKDWLPGLYSPRIRENCQACLSGGQHQSWLLYGRHKGRRFAVYVPEALVPEVQRCLDNGRALQEQLYEAAPRYVRALKRARATAAETSVE